MSDLRVVERKLEDIDKCLEFLTVSSTVMCIIGIAIAIILYIKL